MGASPLPLPSPGGQHGSSLQPHTSVTSQLSATVWGRGEAPILDLAHLYLSQTARGAHTMEAFSTAAQPSWPAWLLSSVPPHYEWPPVSGGGDGGRADVHMGPPSCSGLGLGGPDPYGGGLHSPLPLLTAGHPWWGGMGRRVVLVSWAR